MRFLQRVLLFLALACSQSLAVAHDFEHPALNADHGCMLCTHVPGLDTGAIAPSAATLDLAPILAAPAVRTCISVSGAAHPHYRSRAPPLLVTA